MKLEVIPFGWRVFYFVSRIVSSWALWWVIDDTIARVLALPALGSLPIWAPVVVLLAVTPAPSQFRVAPPPPRERVPEGERTGYWL